MDELTSIKQALSFLLEQENLRQQELSALNEKIDSLFSTVDSRSKEFAGWVNDRDYKDFSDKYGEKLAPYAEKMNKIRGKDYDFMRDAFNAYDPETYKSQDEYVDATVSSLDKYLEDIGIPKDVKVEVRADMNGDGVPETVVDETASATEQKTETEVNEVQPDEAEEEEEKRFMDSINSAVDKELAKNK